MKTSLCLLAIAASAFAVPQAVTEDISPKGSAPEGCDATYDGTFEVTVVKASESKRDLEKRSCNGDGVLVMTLKDGILKDAKDRTGYIASNYQFQFDGPPQAGAKFTSGFSACSNQSLALGSTTVFYKCLSGDFYNLYDRNWAAQCEPVQIVMMPCGGSSNSAAARKVVGSIIATTVVTVVSDGTTKEVATTIEVPMCQIGDGQVQVRTTPCDDMKLPIITAPPVSQIEDGQIQVPTGAPETVVVPKKKIAQPDEPAAETAKTAEGQTKVDKLMTETSILKATASLKYFTSSTSTAKTTKSTEASSTTEAAPDNTDTPNESSTAPGASATASSGMKVIPNMVVALLIGAFGAFCFL
ncbi:covalently-linked cell wall protein [Ilyonectria robusta]